MVRVILLILALNAASIGYPNSNSICPPGFTLPVIKSDLNTLIEMTVHFSIYLLFALAPQRQPHKNHNKTVSNRQNSLHFNELLIRPTRSI